MKKIITILIVLTICTLSAQAQRGNKGASIGLDVALPVGNMSKSLGVGIGGSLKGFYGLRDEADVTLTLGYINFAEKDNLGISYSLIPVLAGYRLKLDQVYLEPQFGFTIMNVKSDVVNAEKSTSNTKIGYGIGVGYLMGNLDLGLRFQDISANGGGFNIIAVRVGYAFAF